MFRKVIKSLPVMVAAFVFVFAMTLTHSTVYAGTTPSISIVNAPTELYVGQMQQLTLASMPSDIKSYKWSSNNESITVDSSFGTITTKSPGTATITVKGYSGGGNLKGEGSCTITVNQIKIINLTLSKATSSSVDQLNMEASIITPASTKQLKYQVWLYDANGWELVSNYDANKVITSSGDVINTPTITTKVPITVKGDSLTADCFYKIHVRIKDANTGEVYDQKTQSNTIVDDQRMTLDTFTIVGDKNGQCTAGDSIILNATGRNVAQYSFSVGNGTSWSNLDNVTPSPIQGSSSAQASYKTDYPGNYTLKVTAKDINNKAKELTIPLTINKPAGTSYNYPELSRVDLTGELKVNADEVITAVPNGNDSTWVYKFDIGEPMRSLSPLKDYSVLGNSITWKPTKTGVYYVLSYVKDKDKPGYQDRIEKYYTVTDPNKKAITLSATSNNPAGNYKLEGINNYIAQEKSKGITQPNFFQFDAKGNGPDTTYYYSFWRYDERGYRLIQDYSTNSKFNWTPSKAGVYTILVRVKGGDSGSYEAQQAFTYVITDPNTSGIDASLNVPDTVSKMSNQTITVDATKNHSACDTLMYKFAVTNDAWGYKELQPFTESNTCTWTPTKAGQYTIIAYVKDAASGSYEITKTKKVTVQ